MRGRDPLYFHKLGDQTLLISTVSRDSISGVLSLDPINRTMRGMASVVGSFPSVGNKGCLTAHEIDSLPYWLMFIFQNRLKHKIGIIGIIEQPIDDPKSKKW